MNRTDLAIEAKKLHEEEGAALKGVKCAETEKSGCKLTTVEILTEEGARKLGKPTGKYVTLELSPVLRRENGAFENCVHFLAEEIRAMMKPDAGKPTLVIGLGNRNITADSIGPLTVRHTLATRHLIGAVPELFGGFRPVAAVQTGVLAETGIESAELVQSLVRGIDPQAVICVDALASLSVRNLCRTVQLTDTGISPGSGVGNRRAPLNRKTLGVPVIALGVPTVVDADTLALQEESAEPLIVTPRNIDEQAGAAAKLLGYAINLALNPELSIDDITMLLE